MDKLCINCIHRDKDPCKPCYEKEHILGWHYYFEERQPDAAGKEREDEI